MCRLKNTNLANMLKWYLIVLLHGIDKLAIACHIKRGLYIVVYLNVTVYYMYASSLIIIMIIFKL